MTFYPIDLDFDESWPTVARGLARTAAKRWARIITRSLSPVRVDGWEILGLRIALSIVDGGSGGQLAR